MVWNVLRKFRMGTIVPSTLALALGLGWAVREAAHARELAEAVKSGTITLDKVEMKETRDAGKFVGHNGVYLNGDTPGSTKFVTGRFVLPPGKTPHPPHAHAEEEVMIIESGVGDILCDGKTTKVGPGSVMYTVPEASHAITNTGSTDLVFYYIKWVGKPSG